MFGIGAECLALGRHVRANKQRALCDRVRRDGGEEVGESHRLRGKEETQLDLAKESSRRGCQNIRLLFDYVGITRLAVRIQHPFRSYGDVS
jgi:hypothetical protein